MEQGLAGITLQLEAVAGSLKTAPDAARQLLDVARQMLRYSLEETKRSVMDLRSQALETRDLQGALTSLARQMTLGTRVQAEVRVTGQPQRLDAAQEHHLLRIGLEALTNALKHGDATRIDIELRVRAGGHEPHRQRQRPRPETRRAEGRRARISVCKACANASTNLGGCWRSTVRRAQARASP